MYKTTSQGLQRAASSGEGKPRLQPIIKHPYSKTHPDELYWFKSAEVSQSVFLAEIKPHVIKLRQNKPTPGTLARMLNEAGLKTANGKRWDERKVIVLMRLLARKGSKRLFTRKEIYVEPLPKKILRKIRQARARRWWAAATQHMK